VSQGTAAATITGTAPNQVLNLVLQKGDAGTNIELQATSTHIQWRLVGGSTWTNLVALSAITGPTGSTGAAGAAVELQASGTHIQWRYVGGSSWTNVIALSSLVGATGATGATGPQGPAGSVSLADETPQPLGVASAGTALSAARADHSHAVGSITYSSLSGIPSAFAPAAHTQAISTVTGLQDALDAKQVAGTYCPLVNSQVPSSYLPSYIDDVIEYANLAAFTEQSTGKIYVARDTGKIYRWSGSAYVEISPSPGSTDSVTEGSTNLYFTNARAVAAIPTATSSVAGLVKAGSGLTITSGVLAATGTSSDDLDGGDYVGVVASISITQQPADVSISINQGSTGSASFTVAASASTGASVAYQWQRSQGSGWESINAAASTTLSLTGLTSSDDDTFYRCVVTAVGIASATSNAASLSVAVIVPAAPVITIATQPQSATIASTTSTASFSITASVSSGTLAYQWQKRESSGSTWASVSGKTSSTLSLTGLDYAADGGDSYRCRLTASGAAAVTSSVAVLNINWAAVPQITLVNVPSTVSWNYGGSVLVTFDRRIDGAANTGISFLWQARSTYSSGEFASVESVLGANSVFGGTASGSLTITQLPANSVTVRCVITATNSYGTTTATTSNINVYRTLV